MTTLTKKIKVFLAASIISAMIVAVSASATTSGDPSKKPKETHSPSYHINSVSWDQTNDDYVLKIKGGSTPTYTMYELFEPLRVVVDIADATIDPSVTLPVGLPQSPVSIVNGKTITDKEPSITRIELLLRNDHNYSVERVENDIIVKFPKNLAQATGLTHQNVSAEHEDKVKANLDDSAEKNDGTFATKLSKIEVIKSPNETKIFLKADGTIKNYKKSILDKNPATNLPDRMFIDIDNIRLIGPSETLVVGTSVAKVRSAKRQNGLRVIFDSAVDKLFDYSISKQSDGLLITINENPSSNALISNILASSVNGSSPDSQTPEISSSNSRNGQSEPAKPSLIIPALIDDENIIDKSGKTPKKSFKTPSPSDLTFAGYNKQRITVDFYKIDLHNVFRLFGDISNLNIVVDEAVGGSLTLALNDVPWDFALDIILNLKDLQKEERFNTIVISPKSKSFTWPERALDNVEFKSDIKIQQSEQDLGGIKISKRLEVPENIVESKKLIHQANIIERKGDYLGALPLYEEAFAKWGENVFLARKIAAMCLVNLEQNAKAIHYAKSVLKLNPGDQDAALQAAIGLTRMQKNTEAKELFELSVSGDKPPSEALFSYSSFCEDQQDYICSLNHLKRQEDLYGDTLSSMVSKARIYDKQGNHDKAAQEYQTILLSGFELPPDLARYIKGRAAFAGR